ncbi:hypothetical protein [Streptomyces atroolivaceus]|uniref:hypothetical protein n=1 Tax=Streptomyces atroolivaceus TaxID=66869 RepID=UPI00369C1070
MRWLEQSNLSVAWAVVVMYLEASGVSVAPTREQLSASAQELFDPKRTAARIAVHLRTRRD